MVSSENSSHRIVQKEEFTYWNPFDEIKKMSVGIASHQIPGTRKTYLITDKGRFKRDCLNDLATHQLCVPRTTNQIGCYLHGDQFAPRKPSVGPMKRVEGPDGSHFSLHLPANSGECFRTEACFQTTVPECPVIYHVVPVGKNFSELGTLRSACVSWSSINNTMYFFLCIS